MTKKQGPESEAFERARGELQAIAGKARGIRRRLLAIAKRLKAAASTGETVAIGMHGPITVEDWSGTVIDAAPLDGGGTTALEAIDNLLYRLARAVDADNLRVEIKDAVKVR